MSEETIVAAETAPDPEPPPAAPDPTPVESPPASDVDRLAAEAEQAKARAAELRAQADAKAAELERLKATKASAQEVQTLAEQVADLRAAREREQQELERQRLVGELRRRGLKSDVKDAQALSLVAGYEDKLDDFINANRWMFDSKITPDVISGQIAAQIKREPRRKDSLWGEDYLRRVMTRNLGGGK